MTILLRHQGSHASSGPATFGVIRPGSGGRRLAMAARWVLAFGWWGALPAVWGQSGEVDGEAEPSAVVGAGVADTEKTGTLPEFTTELAKRAANAIANREWETAKAAYGEMLAADPENALTHANLGVVEFQMGNLEVARGHLEKAVAKKPGIASCWTTLGLIYYQQGEINLATSALTRSLHEAPDSAQAHNYLAVVAKARGWFNAAELELQRAIDLRPDYAEAHFNLALVYLERRPPATELARRHYRRALSLGAEPDPLVEDQLAGKNESETQ